MMMCIGHVSDFEAQLTASVERFSLGRSAEDIELHTRTLDWFHARCCDDGGIEDILPPVEPSRPHSHGRRFIPAWLAAERERCMGVELGEATGRAVWAKRGFVMNNEDPTILHGWVE